MIGLVELIIIGAVLFLNVLTLVGIVSAAMFDRHVWEQTRQSKLTWIILQLLFSVLAAPIYFIAVRPKLKAAQAQPQAAVYR